MTAVRKRFFPGVTARDWNDWRWQLRHALRREAQLARILDLTEDERDGLERAGSRLPVSVTPYYAALLGSSALRRTVIPSAAELHPARGECDDPLGEEAHMPVPCLVHTYPDKVLFLVTDRCPVYCRYCTRARMAGRGLSRPERPDWKRAIDYIASVPAIRDVLISGGEPFVLSDDKIEWLLRQLRTLDHVEIIRFSTKTPAVLPQRFTPGLVRILKRYHPLWLSVHFTHADELTPEVERACARIAGAGIPMCSQTVLLKGVNDDLHSIRNLMQGLLRFRVKPYYLHQCDTVTGSSHFRAPLDCGTEIVRGLHGFTTGYAVPAFMVDAPGGGGKVPLNPDYMVGRQADGLKVRNFEGREFVVPE